MTGRKFSAGRRRVEHDCAGRDCELNLSIGPPRPRPALGEVSPPEDWFSLPLADQLARYFGGAEEAESAYWHHREGLAEADRAGLAKGEQPSGPAAREVYEPTTTWPPAKEKKQR